MLDVSPLAAELSRGPQEVHAGVDGRLGGGEVLARDERFVDMVGGGGGGNGENPEIGGGGGGGIDSVDCFEILVTTDSRTGGLLGSLDLGAMLLATMEGARGPPAAAAREILLVRGQVASQQDEQRVSQAAVLGLSMCAPLRTHRASPNGAHASG